MSRFASARYAVTRLRAAAPAADIQIIAASGEHLSWRQLTSTRLALLCAND